MKKNNFLKFLKILEKRYFSFFFILLFLFLFISLLLFYKNFALLKKEKIFIEKLKFEEKNFSETLKEIQKRERDFEKVKEIEIKDIFNY